MQYRFEYLVLVHFILTAQMNCLQPEVYTSMFSINYFVFLKVRENICCSVLLVTLEYLSHLAHQISTQKKRFHLGNITYFINWQKRADIWEYCVSHVSFKALVASQTMIVLRSFNDCNLIHCKNSLAIFLLASS